MKHVIKIGDYEITQNIYAKQDESLKLNLENILNRTNTKR